QRPTAARRGAAASTEQRAHALDQRGDRVVELPVGEVGCGAEPQDVAAVVGVHAALAEPLHELAGAWGPERGEAAERGERDAAVARDDGGVEVCGVERSGEPAGLVLA